MNTTQTDGHTHTHITRETSPLRQTDAKDGASHVIQNLPLPNKYTSGQAAKTDPHEVEAELISDMHAYVKILQAYL